MIASGRVDGLVFLEDANDIVEILVSTGRMPAAAQWVTAMSARRARSHSDDILGGLF